MNKLTYKNVTRFALPVVIKTADGARTTSFNLSPQKTFDILETQVTGDVKVKTTNGLLKLLVSEEVGSGTTTEFLKVSKPIVVHKYTPSSKKYKDKEEK